MLRRSVTHGSEGAMASSQPRTFPCASVSSSRSNLVGFNLIVKFQTGARPSRFDARIRDKEPDTKYYLEQDLVLKDIGGRVFLQTPDAPSRS
jgi:hypothetical protein